MCTHWQRSKLVLYMNPYCMHVAARPLRIVHRSQPGRLASFFRADEAARANAGADRPSTAPRRLPLDRLSTGAQKNVSLIMNKTCRRSRTKGDYGALPSTPVVEYW